MNILVVDDEPLIVRGLETMLRQSKTGFESIRTASNGRQALELIEESVPQLLITDIRMPKMDGLELCKQVQLQYPLIQKVVISGYNDFEYAQACMSYGVKEYLLKPFTPSKINDLLNKLAAQNEPVFSISAYEDWVERIVEAMWKLQIPEVERLIGEWKSYCASGSTSDAHFIQLMREGVTMIRRRLTLRGFPPKLEPVLETSDKQQCFMQLQTFIHHMLDELALQRGGLDLMKQAKTYIDANITQELSLEEVADYLGISAPYFSLLFKKVHHESFVQYRITKRIQLAKQMLEIPHYRTTDIALEVGYENYPHFSRTFKKVTGVSPLEYRHRMGIK